jgi:hypothetical protein
MISRSRSALTAATTVALEMVANNDVARRFYEREGFTTTFDQMHRRLGPFPFVGSRPGTGNAIWAGCAGQP